MMRRCVQCGGEFDAGATRRKLCDRCKRDKLRAYLGKYYKENKEKRICVLCRKEKALPGRVICGHCLELRDAWRRRNR